MDGLGQRFDTLSKKNSANPMPSGRISQGENEGKFVAKIMGFLNQNSAASLSLLVAEFPPPMIPIF